MNEINSDEYGLLIYPNPVNSEFNVQSSKSMDEIHIVDIAGRELYRTTKVQSSKFKVQSLDLSPGIYFLNVVVDGKRVTRKLVKL